MAEELNTLENGFRHVSNSKRDIRTAADFEGLKLRVIQNPLYIDTFKALGVNATPMPFPEVFGALETKTVDGQENPAATILASKFYEVQKHITLSNHGHLAYAVIANKPFWDGLPADIRTTLAGAMKDATTYANAIAATENAQSLEKIKASGKSTVYTLTAAEQTEWKKALMPVHKEMESRVGKATIDAAYKAAGFVAPK